MKGIILAGGTGSRLHPCTKVTNKHLLPIYDKPMIYYPLFKMINAGIKEIMIVSGPGHSGHFVNLLGSGREFGVKISYEVQDEAGGIAQALGLAEDFADEEPIAVILGDNIFEDEIKDFVSEFESKQHAQGARIFLKQVDIKSAKRFGCALLDSNTQKVTYVEEKPENPKSTLAMTGLYMFDSNIFEIIKTLKPSARGELEITDAIDAYVKAGKCYASIINGFWSDAGTFESLYRASTLIKQKQDVQPNQVADKQDEVMSYFQNKTILITGGLGFIGSNLAHTLVNLNPKKIIIVDSLVPGLGGSLENVKEIQDKLEIYTDDRGDIKNIQHMKLLIKEADIIFNLAGSSKHTGLDEQELNFDSEINFHAQTKFLEACRQVMIGNPDKNLSIIFAGTRDQYGKVPYKLLPVKENYQSEELTDYQSISKKAIESHHFILQKTLNGKGINGIKIVSVRLTNTYGPRQSTACNAVVPVFVKKALAGETVELWGGGNVLRDFNYIDDVVEALLILVSSEKTAGQAYNLGCCVDSSGEIVTFKGGNLKTIKELAQTVINIAQSGSIKEIPYPENRKNAEPGHFCADISKILTMGWRPKTSLEEGIKKTIDFAKKHQFGF
jgi:glucose-1-phosphate thymidylyltransferase